MASIEELLGACKNECDVAERLGVKLGDLGDEAIEDINKGLQPIYDEELRKAYDKEVEKLSQSSWVMDELEKEEVGALDPVRMSAWNSILTSARVQTKYRFFKEYDKIDKSRIITEAIEKLKGRQFAEFESLKFMEIKRGDRYYQQYEWDTGDGIVVGNKAWDKGKLIFHCANAKEWVDEENEFVKRIDEMLEVMSAK